MVESEALVMVGGTMDGLAECPKDVHCMFCRPIRKTASRGPIYIKVLGKS